MGNRAVIARRWQDSLAFDFPRREASEVKVVDFEAGSAAVARELEFESKPIGSHR
jgi:hypothetical protein